MLINRQHEAGSFSMGEFVWWFGEVRDNADPEHLGRCRVAIVGYHTSQIEDDQLPWAYPMQSITSDALTKWGTSPTGLKKGSWVCGFFRDGHTGQEPIIMGSVGGKPGGENDISNLALGNIGKESDGESEGSQAQIDNLTKGVKQAFDRPTWDEPESKRNTEYPDNHVRTTSHGHEEEFDDTEDAERYRRYHPTGTYIEDASDGDQVRKIQRDKYEVVLGDEYINVKGTVRVTIEGDSTVLINGDANLEVKQNMNTYVHGNYRLLADGEIQLKSQGRMYFDGSRIDENLPGPAISFSSSDGSVQQLTVAASSFINSLGLRG